jgi:hypothetical protein
MNKHSGPKKGVEETKEVEGGFPLLLRFLNYTTKHYWRILVVIIAVIIISSFFVKISAVPLEITILFLPIIIILGVITLIRRSIKKLLNHQNNLLELLLGYAGAVFGLILLFGIIYILILNSGTGYLTYGTCTEHFDKNLADNDPLAAHGIISHMYFSSITFFTVGYGDICPMGIDRTIAIINAFVGHAFTAIIMVLALASFAYAGTNKDKK